MKILIVEDEKPAADKLELLLKRYDPEIEIIQRLESVTASVKWFERNAQAADLIFHGYQVNGWYQF